MSGLARMVEKALEHWRRRHWRPGPGLEQFEAMAPMVVVTGGSRGIGLALAHEFARAGNDLLLVARDAGRLEAARRSLVQAFGVRVETLAVDLGRVDERERIEALLRERGAYCDVLVNNAAIGLSGPFVDQAQEAIDGLLALNVEALTDLMHRFLPGMLLRGRGGVLNVASLGGLVPGPWQAAYYASKAYVISLGRAVGREVAGQGVRVTTLAPGPVATDFHAHMGASSAYYLRALGVLRADTAARAGYRGFVWGRSLIVPGLAYKLYGIALQVIPHAILIPFMDWLLRRRGA